jgi:hypothetical protein
LWGYEGASRLSVWCHWYWNAIWNSHYGVFPYWGTCYQCYVSNATRLLNHMTIKRATVGVSTVEKLGRQYPGRV